VQKFVQLKEHMPIEYSIIIPCFNEGQSIANVVTSLKTFLSEQWQGSYEIIVVDDCSTDNTPEILKTLEGIRVFRHPINRGYGAAIKTGIRQAQGVFVATFDGDGQHNPADLVHLCQKIHSEDWALVVGARSKLLHSTLWRMPGKWLLGWLANFLSRTKIPDLNSGLRVFRKEIISRYLHLCADRFSFSTTSTLILLNRGYSLAYLPIVVQSRHGKSTVSLMTGYETFLLILRIVCLFDPLRVFIPASVFLIFIGISLGIYPFFILKRGLTTGSVLVILAGVLVFFFGLLADQISALRKEKYE
jgi:glycosyltransferase involved in cell wall biosynthesis